MTAPHEDRRFTNAATYTVIVTYTVAGGARPATGRRRAERVAEQIANAAARLRDVVDLKAVGGPSDRDGQIYFQQVVGFPAANSGLPLAGQPDRLTRYLDPDHERALQSLAEARTRYRERWRADSERRRAVSCSNADRSAWQTSLRCECVYCQPDRHFDRRTELASGMALDGPRCLCGTPLPAGHRCSRHRTTELVVLDGDPPALVQLAAREPTRDPADGLDRGPHGPDLSPPGP